VKEMKLSFAVSISETRFEAIASGNWQKNIKLMADLKFDGVELSVRSPKTVDLKKLLSDLDKTGLEVSAIGTGQALVDDSLSLTDDDQEIRFRTISRIKQHVDLACHLKTRVIIGLIRGRMGLEPNRRAQKIAYFKEGLKLLADYSLPKGITLLIEPLNRYEGDYLSSAEETIDFIEEIGCSNLALLLDTFHMNIEEADILESFRRSKNYLQHVHIADSNRRSPGEGHLDIRGIVEVLKEIDYDGYLSGEVLPIPDQITAIRNFKAYFDNLPILATR